MNDRPPNRFRRRNLTLWMAVCWVASFGCAPTQAAIFSVPAPLSARALARELNRDEALLRKRLAPLPSASGVQIARERERVILRIPATLLFLPDSAQLRADASTMVPVAAAVKLLKKRRRLMAQVAVYSDSIGGNSANQSLTQLRARNLLSLLSATGLAADRLSEVGAGQSMPLSSNDTPETRSLNRRVEIAFQPGASAPSTLTPARVAAP